MNNNLELVALSEKNIEHSNELIQTALKSLNELTALHLNFSKKIVDKNCNSFKELISFDSSNDLADFVNKISEKIIEINLSNYHDMFRNFEQSKKVAAKMFESILKTDTLSS